MSQHAVIARFNYAEQSLDALFDLEEKLESAIEKAGVGEFDGNEVGGGTAALYMYGPDADKLFAAIESILRRSNFMSGAQVTKRYGSPEDGVREVMVTINALVS